MINPVECNTFNRGKSPIKAYEAGMIGAAAVVTDWPTHDALPDSTCLKVENTEQAWYTALASLVENTTLRRNLAATMREHVVTEANLGMTVPKRLDFYQSIIDRGVAEHRIEVVKF
jgi:hypothetical protein